MSDDIVSRLRNGVYGLNRIPLCEEAADEIERLRASTGGTAQAPAPAGIEVHMDREHGGLAFGRAPAADERAEFEAWLLADKALKKIEAHAAALGLDWLKSACDALRRSGAVHAAPNADQEDDPAVPHAEAPAARAADERSLSAVDAAATLQLFSEGHEIWMMAGRLDAGAWKALWTKAAAQVFSPVVQATFSGAWDAALQMIEYEESTQCRGGVNCREPDWCAHAGRCLHAPGASPLPADQGGAQ